MLPLANGTEPMARPVAPGGSASPGRLALLAAVPGGITWMVSQPRIRPNVAPSPGSRTEMFDGGDPGRVTLWLGQPSPIQPVGRNGKHKERIPPIYRVPSDPHAKGVGPHPTPALCARSIQIHWVRDQP